jgi:predicted DNA-binding protein
MPIRVLRQQLSLTPRQVTALERLAARLSRTKAELVREALDRYLADPPQPTVVPPTVTKG